MRRTLLVLTTSLALTVPVLGVVPTAAASYDGAPAAARADAEAVTGRVTDAAGKPIEGVSVYFRTEPGRSVQTDADGRYDSRDNEFLDLQPGPVLIDFDKWGDTLDDPVYWSQQVQVTVVAGQAVQRDASLAVRPSAVFTVRDAAGRPVVDAPLTIQVRDVDFNGGQWGPIQSGPHTTDATGRYRFTAGFDEVRFQIGLPEGYTGPAVPEWWEDAYSFATARSLTFPAGVAPRRDLTMQLGPAPVTTPPAPAKLTPARPVVRGKARVGRTLRARPGTWRPAPVRLTYAWFRGAKRIPGATKATYRVTRKDVGKRISVRVTGRKAGYTSASRTSAKTIKVRRR
ncbi:MULTISPECIES: carboxypeptidase-like regulatory domain-containing protein [unclassified Nocardioides]|uniref:carboxypeptidase-like regulatory domain-containing protein n=1 Tax=unclassified Nocardioides TaxID=2615069 RepID=UPI003015038F